MPGVLEGAVVVVTGAGGGIGKACAVLAAKEGAKVVVNDLGGSVSGDGAGSAGPAEATAAEIRAAGGEAVANSESVSELAGAKRMVEQALDTFGGLHSMMNPAGILRDRMIHKMSEEDWDAVITVHLRGAFNISRAAIEHFRNQGSGSFVHFSSTSGVIGNIAQSNYGAAKMGVLGLSHILAMEGELKGVRSNVVLPFAWTRMLDSVVPINEEHAQRLATLKATMRSDQVAQLAITLASSEAKDVNGQIFAARGNEISLFSQPRPIRSMSRLEGWTPRTLLDHAFPAMKSGFTDLGPTAVVYPYAPV